MSRLLLDSSSALLLDADDYLLLDDEAVVTGPGVPGAVISSVHSEHGGVSAQHRRAGVGSTAR